MIFVFQWFPKTTSPKMEILKSATQRAVRMLARSGNLVFNEILTSVSFEASPLHSPPSAQLDSPKSQRKLAINLLV